MVVSNQPSSRRRVTYFTATATSTIKNLPVGANDQVLVADSTQSTGMAWKSYTVQGQAAGTDAVINGGMDVWQRNTVVY
jgi:hypothetical protein